MRITITIPIDIKKWVDSEKEKTGITKTRLIVDAIRRGIKKDKKNG